MKRKLLILFLTCVVGWLSPLNAQETTFSYDFNSDMSGWYTQTGANAQAQVSTTYLKWTLTPNVYFGKANYQGNDNTNAIVSYSYDIEGYYYKPDNYIVTLSKYAITSASKLSWYAKAPGSTVGEYYEVLVSTDNGSSFTMVYSETLTNISTMTARECSLSEYQGQTVQIAFRHCQTDYSSFNTNGSHIVIDDVVLSSDGSNSEPDTPAELSVTVSASDNNIYTGETVTLTANATGGTGEYTYSWTQNGEVVATATSATYNFTTDAVGTYTFTCTVNDGENEVDGKVTVNVTERPESLVDLNKQYRVKVYSGVGVGNYLAYFNNYTHSSGAVGGVGVSAYEESDAQIFSFEDAGDGTYYLKTADGYYIKCWQWNVDAIDGSQKTKLELSELGDGSFYLKDYEWTASKGNNYFKVQNVDGTNYVFCDAAQTDAVTWVLEEYVKPIDFTISLPKTYVCDTEESIQLSAVVDGDGEYTYTWTGEGLSATNIANPTVTIPDVDEAMKTLAYTCTVSDANGQSQTKETYLYVCDVITDLTLTAAETSIMEGTSTTLTSNIPDKYSNWTIRWEPCDYVNSCNGGITNTTTALTETTTFTVTVKNPNNEDCYSEASVTVEVTPDPTLRLEATVDNSNICDNQTAQFNAIASRGSGTGYTYQWSTDDETSYPISCLSATNVADPIFTPVENTLATYYYKCTVTDSESNTAEATVSITVGDYVELTPIVKYVPYGEGFELDFGTLTNWVITNLADYFDYSSGDYEYTETGIKINKIIEEDVYLTLQVGYDACASTTGISIQVINENKETEIGSNESSSNLYYLPVRTDKQYSLTQQIYKASELNINEASEITSVSFYTTGLYAQNARNIEVYMANTDLNTFNGNGTQSEYASELADDFVNMTEAANFSGEVTFVSGWTTITFTTPFVYEVGKNVILTVNDKTGSTDNLNEYGCYLTTDEIRSIAMYSSSTIYDPANISTDGSYTLTANLYQNNHVKFGYQAIASEELVAEIHVDNEQICDGDNGDAFNMYATKVDNATYAWYEGGELLGEYREFIYSNANPGVYTITLVVTQDGTTATATIDLTINQMPNANVVMGNGYGFVGDEMTFVVNDHIDGTFYDVVLTVDGVHHNYSSNPTDLTDIASHVFDQDGTFYYTVTATLGEDCSTEATYPVVIYPAANWQASNTCSGQETVFTNKTYAPNGGWSFGSGEGFVWSFGDGEELASNDETVTHAYAEAGTYDVTLTVTKSGVSNVNKYQVIIYETPDATFTYEGEYAHTDITFTATTDAGAQASYAWNFGDGSTGEGMTCKHQYAAPGEYTVTLTVTNNGCASTSEQTLTVVEKESGLVPVPSYVNLGARPVNGWMRPYTVNITPDGDTDVTINSIEIEIVDVHEGGNGFFELSYAELPVTLQPGEMFPVQISHVVGYFGEYEWDNAYTYFNIIANGESVVGETDGEKNSETGYFEIYTAESDEIWETTEEITLTDTPEEFFQLAERHNYLLQGMDAAAGYDEITYVDAAYKFTLEEASNVIAVVDGANPLVYVYAEDFGGEGGPGMTNYVGYTPPYVPTFKGFSFTLEDDPLFNMTSTQGTGWQTGTQGGSSSMYADLDWDNGAKFFRSYQSNGEDELNYFITTDKYYISETARLSMSTWIDKSNMKYSVFVTEDGFEFTTVNEGVVSSTTATTVDVDLSDYAGKEYYIGVMHVGAETFGDSGNFYLDNITLYEPETRTTRESADAGTFEIMLDAGTYYLVAAADGGINSVKISAETLPAPERANTPRPSHGATNISTELEQLTWKFGDYTDEYQVLFGTTNPPTEVLVDWNKYIENTSCEISGLENNNIYYWQVNVRNIVEEVQGTVWWFATPFDAPQNLALTATEIPFDGSTVLSWDAVAPTSLIGYQIRVGDEIFSDLITETTYTIEGLSYSPDPYEIVVEAVYEVNYITVTSKSRSIELKVNADVEVEGYVYDATTSEPIEGATVTYGTASFTTDAEGYYSGIALAGNYTAVARKAGYNKNEVTVNMVPSDEAYAQNFTLEPTMTMATNVIATENDDRIVVDVEWTFDLEGDPMFEDFENGFKYDWTTSPDYPWAIVANGYEAGSAGYELYGAYCVKSTNSDYDYDVATGGNKNDSDYPMQNTESYLELTAHIPFDGKISFDYRIDSEPTWGCDYGTFYIDDEQQGDILYGEHDVWVADSRLEFDVTAGTHTFRWKYTKDNGWYYGTDAFYIDNISFYENTNVYNVYVKDNLKDEEPELLAENLTAKTYGDASWEIVEDGIYQWGVSVKYNEPASDLLNEDFEGIEEDDFLEGWAKTEGPNTEPWIVYEQYGGQYNGIDAYNGGASAMSAPSTPDEQYYIITPVVNASRQSTLEFDYIAPHWNNGVDPEILTDFDKFRVVYGETQEGPWTVLMDYNKEAIDEWTHVTIELPLQENLCIAFEHLNVENWGLGVGLDNVRIHRVAVNGESEIAWSNVIAKGNELIVAGDWNEATNWSRGTVPTADEVAVIKAAGTVNEGAAAKAVLVDNGTVTIAEDGVLSAPTVIDTVAADITINAGGQLVHSNAGVVATFVKGITAYTDANNNDGWYTISSPLAANINASEVDNLLEGEFDLYRYDEPTHYWENYEDAEDAEGPNNTDWDNNSAVIEQGRGYLYANGAETTLSFAGELNVAEVTTTLSAEASSLTGFNLLGNPFAHNIYKGTAFDKDGSLADAYYTLNYHGEWQATTSETPIKSGAGFLVQATEGADLTIAKTNTTTRAAANAMLAVTVVNNVFEDVAYVSFNDGIGLEKIGHMNENVPMVYIPGDFNNYAYATVEEDVTEVPVNFEAMTMGEYTIAVKAKNCEYKTMVLVDNLTGKETNLLKDSYTFMATTTDDPDRFVIKLALDEEVEDSFIYINNGELVFDNLSNDAIINVFDVLGRNIATFNNCGDTTFRVSTDLFADGVYMVRVIEGNNVKVQKMVIE